MKLEISKEAWEIIALLVALALVIGLAVGLLRVVDQRVRSTDGCFVFPPGWELVSISSWGAYARAGSTYICHNVETGQYAKCEPVPVDCR